MLTEATERPAGRVRPASRGAWGRLVTGSAEGFLTPATAVALGAYVVFALSFARLAVANDGLVYYSFLRRLLGEDVAEAGSSQEFAPALFNLPFYAAARAVEAAAGVQTVMGAPIGEFAIFVASTAALVATLWLGWHLLTELGLPAGPAVLALTLFGSPLFYYTVFQPSYKHAVDALLLTLFAVLLRRSLRSGSALAAAGAGAAVGALVLVRFANVAFLPAALAPLLVRRDARGALTAVSAAVACVALLLAIPAARGVPVEDRPQVDAAGLLDTTWICEEEGRPELTLSQCLHNKLGLWWDPWAPVKMLFSVERGLFLWTPLTALATAGFVLLLARRRDERLFLGSLGLGALVLLLLHVGWADFWTGGFSFSQRFLASLFPVFLLGTAELLRRFGAPALAALSVCVLFSVVLAFTHFFGWEGISERDGLDTMLRLYAEGERTPWGLAKTAGVHALERWGLR